MNQRPQKNDRRSTFFFTSIIFAVVLIVFLFSGTAVNKYYQIETPEPDRIIEPIAGSSQKNLDPGSIKILNWNVYKNKREGWKEDFIQLSRGVDIILIQEACMEDKNQNIFNISGMGGVFARSFSYCDEAFAATGVMTLAKAGSVSADYVRTQAREPVTHTPKMSLLTEYPLRKNKNTLLVVNIHSINFVRATTFESQLTRLEKKIKGHRGPVIFAGDFNTWNKKRVSILLRITNRLGLKEADFFPDTRTKRFKHFLDHVFYRGLRIKQTKVFQNVQSSDHKAMEVEFYLPASKAWEQTDGKDELRA